MQAFAPLDLNMFVAYEEVTLGTFINDLFLIMLGMRSSKSSCCCKERNELCEFSIEFIVSATALLFSFPYRRPTKFEWFLVKVGGDNRLLLGPFNLFMLWTFAPY